MRTLGTGILVAMVLGLIAAESKGQVIAASGFEGPIGEGRTVIEGLLGRIPGAAIAVGVGGQIVWSEGFGYANVETESRADSNTIFRIFSLSKAITAVTLMRLQQAGRIELDRPISGLLTGLPTAVGSATPRQLAGHLGGIRHYRNGEAWNDRHCETPRDALAIFAADGSVHPPGSAYLYSSWGYALLSRVIEAAGESPFAELVASEVLEPVQMTSTSLGTGIDPSRTTQFYERRGWIRKRNRPAEEVDISCKWGGGAFLATPLDVARMGMSLLEGELLEPAALHTLFTGMKTAAGDGTGYGMGLGVAIDDAGSTRLVHTGSGAGGRSAMLMYPTEQLVVVVAANNREEAIVDFAAEVTRAFLSEIRGERH